MADSVLNFNRYCASHEIHIEVFPAHFRSSIYVDFNYGEDAKLIVRQLEDDNSSYYGTEELVRQIEQLLQDFNQNHRFYSILPNNGNFPPQLRFSQWQNGSYELHIDHRVYPELSCLNGWIFNMFSFFQVSS